LFKIICKWENKISHSPYWMLWRGRRRKYGSFGQKKKTCNGRVRAVM
jgi:hypothetical protein